MDALNRRFLELRGVEYPWPVGLPVREIAHGVRILVWGVDIRGCIEEWYRYRGKVVRVVKGPGGHLVCLGRVSVREFERTWVAAGVSIRVSGDVGLL